MSRREPETLGTALSAQSIQRVVFPFIFLEYALSLVLCLPLFSAGPAPVEEARVLLQTAQAMRQNRPPVVFEDETTIRPYDGKPTPMGFRGSRYLTSIRQDRGRIDVVRRKLVVRENGKEEAAIEGRSIWDGQMYIHRDRAIRPDFKPVADFSYDTSQNTGYILRGCEGIGHLDGFFVNSQDHYTAIMLRAKDPALHENLEDVDGHPCRVVEGETEKGHYTAWIDTNCGYCLRQIEIQESNEFNYTLKNIKLEQIDGVWFPTAGTARVQFLYKNGAKDDLRYESTRRNVTFHPDFEKIGAFQMDLPEGTRLINYQDRETAYVWHNNKPEEVRKVHNQLVSRQGPVLVVEQWYNTASQPPDLRGKVVLLDFFGVWCNPCMAQIPFLKSLWEKYSNQGLVMVGVHTPLQKEGIAAFLARDKVSYPIAVDREGQTARAYNVFFYPTLVVLDRAGRIRAVNPEKESLGSLLESLLKEAPPENR